MLIRSCPAKVVNKDVCVCVCVGGGVMHTIRHPANTTNHNKCLCHFRKFATSRLT
jgi:hypothetical protein